MKIGGNVKEGITYVDVGTSDQVHKRADAGSEVGLVCRFPNMQVNHVIVLLIYRQKKLYIQE